MARANKGGWDFIKVNKTYQYKEDGWIAMVTILEDKSDENAYIFKLRVEKATDVPPQNGEFEVSHDKHFDFYYSGMLQFYEEEEYTCKYSWDRQDKIIKDITDKF